MRTTSQSFPTWWQLAEKIYDALYPDKHKEKKETLAGNGALKIASEYEQTFGRTNLDKLIIDSLPEDNFSPGSLHKLLLKLPWSDVFTTNYDTLLERTLPFIHDRKYEVVYTSEDLPGSSKPRIVKVHGSLPPTRRFVLTEEDFRTYPAKFAPFVNTVQQSIMENTFCLIGFSGDDPNFQYWSGWVRDHLGDSAPKIYLCGLLNLSNTQRRLLESKNVIPIDLNPVIKQGVSNPHAAALEWFLLSLQNSEPPNSMKWPDLEGGSTDKADSNKYFSLPPLPLNKLTPKKFSLQSFPQTFDKKQAQELRNEWSIWRKNYPGWIVCPKDKRDDLWQETDWVFSNIMDFLKKQNTAEYWSCRTFNSDSSFSPIDKLLLLNELTWRFETSMVPLFYEELKQEIETTVLNINPFPTDLELIGSIIKPDNEDYSREVKEEIQEAWVALLFSLCRDARESFLKAKFEQRMAYLENVVSRRVEWKAQWHYEWCSFHLFQLDQIKLRQSLQDWPFNEQLPFWEVRRASLLVEIDEFEKAKEIAEKALEKIRSQFRPFEVDYQLLSQEAWTMVLLKSIEDGGRSRSEDKARGYRGRWEELAQHRCDPWIEIEWLETSLSIPKPKPTPRVEQKRDFERKESAITHHSSPGLQLDRFRPAFAMLRIQEVGALPFHCGGVRSIGTFFAGEWIEVFFPEWAIISIIRAGKSDKLKDNEWLNKAQIGLFEKEVLNNLGELLTTAVIRSVNWLMQNPMRQVRMLGGVIPAPVWSFSERLLQTGIEILSRLCFCYSNEQLEKLFNLAIQLYKVPIFRQEHQHQSCISTLFSRLFEVLPNQIILNHLPELLALPLCNEQGFMVTEHQSWTDPFSYIDVGPDASLLSKGIDSSKMADRIEELIQVMNKKELESRKAAILRLARLYSLGLLTETQIDRFGRALWEKIDNETELPAETGLVEYSLLGLPEPNPGNAKELFRRYVSRLTVPRQYTRTAQAVFFVGVNRGPFIGNWLRGTVSLFKMKHNHNLVDWTIDEAKALLQELCSWWEDEKEGLKQDSGFISSRTEVQIGLTHIDKLLACIVLPRFSETDDESKQKVQYLLADMEKEGIPTLRSLAMSLFVFPEMLDNIVARKIRKGLYSGDRETVFSAIEGLVRWLAYAKDGKIPKPPANLLDELFNKVTARRFPALVEAIEQVKLVLNCLPDQIQNHHIDSLVIGLEYLIEETQLPKKLDYLSGQGEGQTIPFDERPRYRLVCSKLALSFFKFLKSKDRTIPAIVEEWREASQNSQFADIRKVWVDQDTGD